MELSELRQKPHLSASSIGDYMECGMLYRFSRIDRLPMEFVADSLVFGTAIHKTLEEFYREKLTGNKLTLKDIHQIFEKHWHETADGRDEIQYAEGKDFKTLLMQGTDLLSIWHQRLPEDAFKIIGIENAFSFTLPGLPIPVVGAMDLIEEDDSGTIIITDFKTSKKSYSADEIDRNPQMTIYQLAAKANGFSDREIILRFDCMIKTLKPKFEQYYTVRTEVDEARLIKKIHSVWHGISAEVFIPNDQSFRHKNCAYRNVCDEWFLQQGGDE
jgi:putative RecB family exonuclease